jgi:hypothetical protein
MDYACRNVPTVAGVEDEDFIVPFYPHMAFEDDMCDDIVVGMGFVVGVGAVRPNADIRKSLCFQLVPVIFLVVVLLVCHRRIFKPIIG